MRKTRPILLLLPLVLASGCPTPTSGTADVHGALALSVSPDRALQRGETVALTVTASSTVAFGPETALIITVPAGVEVIDGAPFASGALRDGAPLVATLTIRIPDDDVARRARVHASAHTADGRIDSAQRSIDLNPAGRLLSRSADLALRTAPVTLELSADRRLSDATSTTLVLRATAAASHGGFQLGFELPPSLMVESGVLELAPAAVAAGELREARITVRAADLRSPVLVRGWARYGRPTEATYGGGSVLALEVGR